MNEQSKKIFPIVIALILGLGIVFFSWKGADLFTSKPSPETASEGNWKDSLLVVPSNSPAKVFGSASTWGTASTTTDTLAQNLLINYALLAKSNGTTTVSDAEAQALAQGLVENIGSVQGKQYGVKDLNISSNNSGAAIATYSQGVTKVIQSFLSQKTKADLVIVLSDPRTSTGRAAELKDLAANYEKLIRGLLSLKTPSEAAAIHLRLVQAYANTQASLLALADVYTDPLRGLAALTQYRKEIDNLATLSKDYSDYLSKNSQ